jgi:pyruvate dehydrogenase E1 component alpha subunit
MAVGVALADLRRLRRAATVAFFGDGAANEGAVHEALNLAGARRAPVVFVLENNGLAISTTVTTATAARALVDRAAGYGMPGIAVDGQHVEAIHDAAAVSLERARSGQGPSLIEVRMERWEPHAHGLPDLRSRDELQRVRSRDGVATFRSALFIRGLATEAHLDAIDRECREEVDSAVAEGLRLGLDLTEPTPYDEAAALALAYGG